MNINLKVISQYKANNYQRYSKLISFCLIRLFATALLIFSSHLAYGNLMHDPTTPLNQMPKSEGKMALNLVAISGVEGRYFAIINGQRVYEGSIVDGAKIEAINDKSVVYSYKGKRHTLNMRLSLIQ